MTTADRPYTDADLRYEATHQLHNAATDHDFMGIGEQLVGRYVHYVEDAHGTFTPPPGTPRWDDLPAADFDAAQRAIDDLLTNSADLSEWAVNLGADGLEPTGNVLGLEAGDTPLIRIHLAFHPDMDNAARTEFTVRLARFMADLG